MRFSKELSRRSMKKSIVECVWRLAGDLSCELGLKGRQVLFRNDKNKGGWKPPSPFIGLDALSTEMTDSFESVYNGFSFEKGDRNIGRKLTASWIHSESRLISQRF